MQYPGAGKFNNSNLIREEKCCLFSMIFYYHYIRQMNQNHMCGLKIFNPHIHQTN